MNARQVVYESWNWEFDYGVNPIQEGQPKPSRHAIAFHDDRGSLFRVVLLDSGVSNAADAKQQKRSNIYYDYFCDDSGRIVEKRSLDENFDLVVIVRYEYDTKRQVLTETAWYPESSDAPQRITREWKP